MIVSLVFEGEHIRRGIEVVITGLTRNQFARKRTRVRIPSSPPTQDTERCPFLRWHLRGFEQVPFLATSDYATVSC